MAVSVPFNYIFSVPSAAAGDNREAVGGGDPAKASPLRNETATRTSQQLRLHNEVENVVEPEMC